MPHPHGSPGDKGAHPGGRTPLQGRPALLSGIHACHCCVKGPSVCPRPQLSLGASVFPCWTRAPGCCAGRGQGAGPDHAWRRNKHRCPCRAPGLFGATRVRPSFPTPTSGLGLPTHSPGSAPSSPCPRAGRLDRGSGLQDNSLGHDGQRGECVATPTQLQKGPLVLVGEGGEGLPVCVCVSVCPSVRPSVLPSFRPRALDPPFTARSVSYAF